LKQFLFLYQNFTGQDILKLGSMNLLQGAHGRFILCADFSRKTKLNKTYFRSLKYASCKGVWR